MESISSASVVKLRIHVSVSAMMSGLWFFVGEVVECGEMFRGEHGASVKGPDEEVLQGGWDLDWLDILTEKQCGGE